jgi:cysteine desulfurase
MLPYFNSYFGNPSSFYQTGREARQALEKAREDIAAVLNADVKEIFFTACGTEADNWAVKGAALSRQAKGRHIITSAIEHHAVLHACEDLEKQGFELTVLPVDQYGMINPQSVREAIRPDTILVTIMMANNEIGTILPVKEIAAICHDKGCAFSFRCRTGGWGAANRCPRTGR